MCKTSIPNTALHISRHLRPGHPTCDGVAIGGGCLVDYMLRASHDTAKLDSGWKMLDQHAWVEYGRILLWLFKGALMKLLAARASTQQEHSRRFDCTCSWPPHRHLEQKNKSTCRVCRWKSDNAAQCSPKRLSLNIPMRATVLQLLQVSNTFKNSESLQWLAVATPDQSKRLLLRPTAASNLSSSDPRPSEPVAASAIQRRQLPGVWPPTHPVDPASTQVLLACKGCSEPSAGVFGRLALMFNISTCCLVDLVS